MIISAKKSEGERYTYRNIETPKLTGNIAFLWTTSQPYETVSSEL